MTKFEKLYERWTKLKPVKFTIVTTGLSMLLTIPIFILFDISGIKASEIGGPDIQKHGVIGMFLIGVILAPVIETLLAQVLPISLTQKFVKWNTKIISVFISTLLFSLGHLSYSLWYFILIIPTGSLLALTYIIFQERKESGFWMTFSVHSLKNLIAFIITIGQLIR
jgi:membrane protease YdiL (CAAX protease family)